MRQNQSVAPRQGKLILGGSAGLADDGDAAPEAMVLLSSHCPILVLQAQRPASQVQAPARPYVGAHSSFGGQPDLVVLLC